MIITINIPANTKCLLKQGDRVDFDEPFLEEKFEKQADIAISKELGIHAKKIFRYLKKFVGDSVKKGEIIAIKKGFITEKKIVSPFTGIIKEIDHEQGRLILTIDEKNKKIINSFFKGEINKIKDRLVELIVEKGEELTIKKANLSFGGEVFYFDSNKTPQLIGGDINNKIIFIESVSSVDQSKIEALGALGIVTLTKLNDVLTIPYSQIKNIDEFKKIAAKKFPYCLVNHYSSKIYFYQ